MQWLDTRSFLFHPKLSVTSFLALVLKVCWNRFSWHARSVAELSPSKLCNFAHSVTLIGQSAKSAAVSKTDQRKFVSFQHNWLDLTNSD